MKKVYVLLSKAAELQLCSELFILLELLIFILFIHTFIFEKKKRKKNKWLSPNY